MKKLTLATLGLVLASNINAQLSTNPDKFLGNITTSYNVDYGKEKYYTLWNQITPENESKWASIEGARNNFDWSGADKCYNYAKKYNFPFKFHALVWGSQYPGWLKNLTPAQRYKEIVEWMDGVKKHYPDLQLIDVVNEAVSGHQADTYLFIEALGGTGKTGYDWIIKAFELAAERWPNAILIYNDFNTFQWNTDQYIDLVKTLRNAGAPIDAYGCQSHDLTGCNYNTFKSSMDKIQNALKMPCYISEYDIGTDDDNLQLQNYKEQIKYMWECDYVAGITLWGYIYGHTWTDNGNSGIIKDGKDRPAMKWLREYMATDAAKNAKSPYPGMWKEASVYVKPSALNIEKGKNAKISVLARMKTKTIEKVELYANNVLIQSMTEAPYEVDYTPEKTGAVALKAVVTNTDGTTFVRYSDINVGNPRAPFKNTRTALPGVLQAENFDSGTDGIAFHDANSNKEGDASSYRTDNTGIDIVKGGTGYAVGYGQVGEWMEYSVDVKEAGLYSYDISYSAPEDGAAFSLSLITEEGLTPLTADNVTLRNSGGWSTYKTAHGRLTIPLEAGEQIIRLALTGGSGTYVINIDKITFNKIDLNEDINIALSADPKQTMVTTKTVIKADVESEKAIKNVKIYVNGILNKTLTTAPYETTYTPSTKGTYEISAIATDEDGKQSKIAEYSLVATAKRSAYKSVSIPGIIEAENFDKGEDGLTFHDSDNEDQGKAGYRSDNGGVDIVKSNNRTVIGYTVANEWLEYTVNVKEAGKYTCTSTVSSGTTGSSFSIGLVKDGKTTTLWKVTVPKTADNSWDTYKTVNSTTRKDLEAGTQVIRITITGANCNIDKIELKCEVSAGVESVVELVPCKYNVYSTSGVFVGQIKAASSIEIKNQILSLTNKGGIYILKNTANGKSTKINVNN